MTNFFNFNFGFPFTGMNNRFMPNFSFSNFFMPYQMPTYNFFNGNYNNLGSFGGFGYNVVPQLSTSLFFESLSPNIQKPKKTDNNKNTEVVSMSGTDTLELSSKSKTEHYILDNYNAFKGERLAKIALNNTVGWTGFCATYVKNAIANAGLGYYLKGHAYQMPNILKYNNNFKEISIKGINVKKLPAGCILVYNKGVEGYSKQYGHVEITTGDGRAVSDGITKNLHKKPSHIFIPV